MENNTLQIEITSGDQTSEVESWMKNKLRSLPTMVINECCIYKVPEFLREEKETFYRPSVVSIGPVFYQDTKLQSMQEVKWMFLKYFLEHPQNNCPDLKDYINLVRKNEEKIRLRYEEDFSLSSDEFIKMIVLDAAFLIYLFLCVYPNFSLEFPAIDKVQGLFSIILSDTLVQENQLPYYILDKVYDMAFGEVDEIPSLIHLCIEYVSWCDILEIKSMKSVMDGDNKIESCEHLVDLLRACCCASLNLSSNEHINDNPTTRGSVSYLRQKVVSWISSLSSNEQSKRNRETDDTHRSTVFPYTAKTLRDAGVKFEESESDNQLQITFADGKLKIPKLAITDSTEYFWRNILAFEQYHYVDDLNFANYVSFLDALIDTVEDVKVLVHNKVIHNILGSDEEVVNLFNKICKHMTVSSVYYSNVSKAVNDYASIPWNQWSAILRTKYFNHPWVIISVIAAFMLFVLTLLQTIASYVYK